MSNSNIGPLIPGSKSFESNQTESFETNKIIVNSISDGICTLSNGRLSNILDPINLNDAANKHYTDGFLNVVNLPNYSIQYNVNGNFDSSTNLLFYPTAGLLYSKNTLIGYTNNQLSISNGQINNLSNSVITSSTIGQIALSKGFIESFNNITISTNSSLGITYSAQSMIFGSLYRNPASNCIDCTADSSSLYSTVSSITALSTPNYSFDVYNTSSVATISVISGTNVSFVPNISINIYPNYKLSGQIKVNSSSSVTFYITGLYYYPGNDNYVINYRAQSITSKLTRITNLFQYNTNILELSDQNITYVGNYVSNVILRNFNGLKIDTFADISTFINMFYFSTPIYGMFSTGAIEFVVKNISLSGNLVITSGNGWTTDPNSNMIIGPGRTGYFYLYVDVQNYTGYIYCIGICNTV